jgi:hypothetical protein
MEIKQKCGYIWTFHKYRNIKTALDNGLVVVSIEIQEAPRKRWNKIYFLPRTLESTDVEDLESFVGWL